MIYVYAFCPSPAEPLSMPEGIAHPAVQLMLEGALGAIAEFDLDIAQLREDDHQLMEAVLSHDRVLGQLFTQTMLLPLRFGTQFTSETSLRTYLQTHQEAHRQRLATLADKAEYLIKLMPKSPELPSLDNTLKGRDYFLAKKRRLQAQTQAQTQQSGEFQQFLAYLQTVDAEVIQSEPNQAEERLYILSSRDPAIATAQFSDWQQRIPSWQLYCSEPLPPYHFAM